MRWLRLRRGRAALTESASRTEWVGLSGRFRPIHAMKPLTVLSVAAQAEHRKPFPATESGRTARFPGTHGTARRAPAYGSTVRRVPAAVVMLNGCGHETP